MAKGTPLAVSPSQGTEISDGTETQHDILKKSGRKLKLRVRLVDFSPQHRLVFDDLNDSQRLLRKDQCRRKSEEKTIQVLTPVGFLRGIAMAGNNFVGGKPIIPIGQQGLPQPVIFVWRKIAT